MCLKIIHHLLFLFLCQSNILYLIKNPIYLLYFQSTKLMTPYCNYYCQHAKKSAFSYFKVFNISFNILTPSPQWNQLVLHSDPWFMGNSYVCLIVFHSVAVGHYSASGSAVWRDFVVWLRHRALVSAPLGNSALPSPAFHWNDTSHPNSCELLPPIEEKITHFIKNISWVISLWAQYPTLFFISVIV